MSDSRWALPVSWLLDPLDDEWPLRRATGVPRRACWGFAARPQPLRPIRPRACCPGCLPESTGVVDRWRFRNAATATSLATLSTMGSAVAPRSAG